MKHKNVISTILVCLLLAAMLLGAVGCAGPVEPEAPPTPEQTAEPTPESTPEPTPEPTPEKPEFVNPLTGMPVTEDISGRRPCAVMVNNISVAQPQSGISQADIVYEVLVEGGITRMLAVFQDIDDIGIIGSVRSSRHYYIDLAQGLDAIYIHAGGSPYAYETIWDRDIDNIDGVNGYDDIYYRDQARMESMGYEHSLMIDTSLIASFLERQGIRSEHETGYAYNLKFDEKSSADTGDTAKEVTVYFSPDKSTQFTYDSGKGAYLASQYGGPYIDGENDQQVSPRNIIIVYTDVYSLAGDTYGRLDMDLVGSGDGYFICDGKYVPITWSKDSPEDPFGYKLLSGEDVTFGTGSSYVCILPIGNEVAFS